MKQTYCFFSTFAHRVLTAASARAKLLTAIALCLFSIGNVWGVDVAYTFSTATNNPGDAKDWYSDNIDSYTSWKATIGTNPPKYYNSGTGLRVYNNGSFSITSTKTLKTITLTFSGTSYTFSSSNNSQVQTVNPNAQSYSWSVSRACRLQKIEITYESVFSYTVTAVANPTGGGSVSVEGNKITATPNTGWQISTANPYTVASGTATVEQSGNEFTVTSSSDCTVQINFEKEQTYTLTYQIGNDTYTKECTGGTNILSKLPASATSCDATSTAFIGWTATPVNGKQPTCPQLIAEDATITSDMTVYAVFAKATRTDGGELLTIFTPTDDTTQPKNGIIVQMTNTTGSNGYYQAFANSTMRVKTTEGSITKIVITATASGTSNYAPGHFTSDVGTYSYDGKIGTWTGNATQIDFSAAKQVRMTKIEVVTTGSSSTTYTDYMTACEECTELEATWKTMMATNVVRQTATLSWGMSSTAHVTGYSVHVWSTSSTAYNRTFTVEGAATTTHNLTDLLRETTYNWTVTALTEHGWCTTTSDAQQFETIGAEQLPAPTDLQVVYQDGKYTFSWKKVENATEYKMTNAFSSSSNIKGTSSTRTLDDLIPGNEYTATVQAIGDGANYTNSETASVTFTAPLYTLTLSVTDNGTTTTKTFELPKVTLPAEISMCEASEGWTFAGWSETDIAEESTTTAPALIAAGTEYGPDDGYIKQDRTLYAVFSKVDEETVSDTYEKVTSEDDMTNGNYMIVGLGKLSTYYTLTSTPATTSGWFNGSKLGELVDAYSTTDPTQIWEIKKEGTNYLIYNAAKKQYLNINSSTLVMEDAGIPYTLSVAYAGNVLFKATKNTSYYLASHTGQDGIFNAYTQANTVYLYKNATQYIYTTSPQCTDCNDPSNNCPEYPLVLNDRGVETTMDSYWVGEQISEPVYTPQGECAGYWFEGWTTEAGLSNLTATEWASKKIQFPYKMPKKAATDGKLTLYAVYRSTLTDEYRLVTDMNELTTGEYVITALAENQEHALSFVRSDYIENFGSQPVEITKDDNGIDIVSTTNPEIIWTITQTEGGYTLEALHFDGMAHRLYLNIVSNYLQFEETAKPYTITKGETYAAFTLCSSEGYCMSYNGTDFVADETASKLYLYKRVQDIRYSTSTHCDPSVIGVGTVAVTSAQGIWVEAVTQPYVYAERLTQNRDGALVDIIASTASSSPFTLKAVDATGVGDHSITLVSGETRDNFAGRFKVVYTPGQTGGIDKDRITVKVTKAGDPATVYATHTFEVQGRSLPGEFVIAAQTADGWVALPADLGNSSLAYLKAPYSIEVDNEADPTKATQAPETAVYHAAMRYHENTNPRGVRLLNSRDESLCGDYSKDPDHRLWFDGGEVTNSQSWALRSLALKDYYIRLQAAPAGHYLFYNATTGGGKIGYYEYKQQNRLRLRLLPVETTCVRYDAPALQVGSLKSTSVTLEWPQIQNATGYEYSLDRGTTWIPFVQGTDWTVENGVNIGTIDGLAPETRYTVWVRVAVGEDETNCSEAGIRTFTMPECDDAPHNLWASATADAVTVVWEAASPTATVKIYSDEDGTTLFKAQESGATENHQCRITGLEQNTKYWYQVFSAGTCASAIASFTTESKDISIVEWEKQAVIVDINTEIGEGVDVLVQKRSESSEESQNIADDIFFSKYYEATYNVKLLGLFNGTKEAVDLSNLYIYVGTDRAQPWSCKLSLSGLVANDLIEPNQEIIIWYHQNSTVDKKIVDCIGVDTKQFIWSPKQIAFGGRQAILLIRGTKIIDIIGAIKDNNVSADNAQPVDGTNTPTWGDDPGFIGWGYSIDNNAEEIQLSTNRCLLIRSSNVKSGQKAVEKNVGKFTTLGDGENGVTADCEWLGRQVSLYTADGIKDDGVQSSCDGFNYVTGFNYNNYYITYEKMDEAVFNGTPNPNGTYTIKVPELPQLACTDIRLQLTKNGEVTASVEQKVPIIVTEDAQTTDALFSENGLTPEICQTCDVVVRDKSRLTHATGDNNITEFRDMFIYHDSELEIADGTSLRLNKLRMFALNDSVSYAIINNTNDADNPTITVNEVSHVKRIDGRYWYPFSLPYNCHISQISALNGKGLGKYGTDWCIKYYDGEQRQKDGTSASLGQVSQYWYKLGESDMLEAYKGYIIGLYCPTAEEAHQKSVNFAPARQIVYTETDASKTTYVHNWPDNLEAEKRHHGWNFTGSPYISLFGVQNREEGLFSDQLKMGYTDKLTGEQLDKEHVYLSIPDGKDTRTYTQVLASATGVKPFTAYFVQAIDPTDRTGHTLELTYYKTRRTFPGEAPNPALAPRRAAERDAVLFAEINLTDNAAGGQDTYLRDNTGVLVSDRFSADYEIGDDLTKMYAAAGKPQLYTTAGNEKMAYNALPDGLAHNLPLGIYVPKAGEYTLSLNRHASRLEGAESVCLLYNGLVVADLLRSDYTILATAKGEQAGYMLDIRRASQVITSAEGSDNTAPYAVYRDGMLTVGNLPAGSDLQVYDVLGRLMWTSRPTDAARPVVIPAPQTGVYMVVVSSEEQQYVFKTLTR